MNWAYTIWKGYQQATKNANSSEKYDTTRPNKKVSEFRVRSLKILGRVGTLHFFSGKI